MIQLLLLIGLITTSLATSFRVQPIEQQIRESDGLFQGHYLRKKFIVLENGTVATQMMFKMTREVGLDSDVFGMDEVIVHYPGGKTADGEVRIEGVPDFVPGEKVVLFIRNVENRFWGMNLGFGTFKVINYGSEVVMINGLFPDHPQVGQVRLEHFEKIVKQIKGSHLKIVKSPDYPAPLQPEIQRVPASVEEGQNRTVASETEQSDNQEAQPNLSIFWLLAALGITGGIFRMSVQKARK